MRISTFGGGQANGPVEEVIAAARRAADDGFAAYWIPQIFGLDALTTLAVVGRAVDGIDLGTAVVPTYPRHPMMLAQQAHTTNIAAGGGLHLGIGLSHRRVIEGVFGYTYDRPVRHMREYLSALRPLVHGDPADVDGDTLSAHGELSLPSPEPFPILVAALGPQMLALAGRLADGTITWMTGPETLASHTVPRLQEAAAEHDRAPLRVVAALPVHVTDDVDEARERAARSYAGYGELPSYRDMLDREGAEGPADLAIVGDEDHVAAQLDHLADIGVTDFVAAPFYPREQRERTTALLRSLV